MIALSIIGGLVLILLGANALVEGASNIARRFGLSEFLIGLTIVGIGTSTPEMVVSFISAAAGKGDMAVGNVAGSNIFNILVILGITALIRPLQISSSNLKRDVTACITASLLLFVPFGLQWAGIADAPVIGRVLGGVFLALFAYYMYSCFKDGKEEDAQEGHNSAGRPFISVLMILGGLAGLVFGGDLFVDGASALASSAGIPDSVIAITILAGGTSLPELATCVVAAVRKKGDLALGNALGSNISNILLILGGSAMISPLNMVSISVIDMAMVLLGAVLVGVSAFTFKKSHLDRIEGGIFLLIYIVYMIYLIGTL